MFKKSTPNLNENVNNYIHTIKTLLLSDYNDIILDNNYSRLLTNKNIYVSDDILYKHWCKINDDITEIIGQNEKYIEYLRHKIKAAVLMNSVINGGQEHNRVLAQIEMIDASEIEKEFSDPASSTENLLILSKIQGYKLKAEETTVEEYFTLLKMNSGNGRRANKK